jgi:oligoribonuclease NrnB/cAMP/cGMP phosphodiesterase (DHH superfamily)
MDTKQIVVIYHGNCPDGFGAAYIAWKKFEDSASYIGVQHGEGVPLGLDGKEIYMIDFSYPADTLLELESRAARLVVLDHHVGAQDAVEQVREHIFDNDHSGTGIAWKFFFPDTPLPRVLQYVQDADLWRNSLPNNKEIGAYLSTMPFDFKQWDALVREGDVDDMFDQMVARGTAYLEYVEYVYDHIEAQAQEVQFGDYTVMAVNCPRLFRSAVGHRLATKHGPFAIVFYEAGGVWHFSLRGDGSIDLSKVAQTYGGNGHKSAASFRLPFGASFPFKPLKK